YIIHVHHAYLKSSMPALQLAIETFAAGHEKQYPYISRVYEAFKKLATVLNEQMLLEEVLLFPYIRQVSQAAKRTESYGPLFVRTLQKPIGATTEKWQAQTVLLLVDLRTAANQYAFPEKACTNHQVIYHKLAHFDADLVRHKYLEHNFLYPNAAQLELELLQL
ncbi:MAG TPA: hypothetical protein VM010_06975, partial [Chitinophagaceae bacterium]|nr:hypothetical protein [Chitinophagaceae bacterium]